MVGMCARDLDRVFTTLAYVTRLPSSLSFSALPPTLSSLPLPSYPPPQRLSPTPTPLPSSPAQPTHSSTQGIRIHLNFPFLDLSLTRTCIYEITERIPVLELL